MELIHDQKFKNGFMLNHIDALVTRDIIKVFNYMGTVKNEPVWKVAQWCCKHNLANGTERVTMDFAYVYQDESKRLKVYPGKGRIALELDASNEYTTPRRDGEGWPHILLEQEFTMKEKITDYKSCVIDLEFTVTKFKDYMQDSRTNIHTAQFQWFFAISNQNQESKGYGDFIWFGLSFFDFPRYDFPPAYEAQDGGKEENTGKFISIIDSKNYLKEPVDLNKPVHIHCEIMGFINQAIDHAYQKGYLKDTKREDLVFHNMNIGWEVTGTFDVDLEIHNLSCEVYK